MCALCVCLCMNVLFQLLGWPMFISNATINRVK